MAVALHVADGAQEQFEVVVVAGEVHFVVVGDEQGGVVVEVEEAAVFFVDAAEVAFGEEVGHAFAARAQAFFGRRAAGLQVDDEVGHGHFGHDFVFGFPKQGLFVGIFVVVEDDGDEDFVFFQQEVGDDAAVFGFFGVDDVDGFGAAQQKVQFGGKAVVGGVLVEEFEKRVGFGAFGKVEGVEVAGQPPRLLGFAAADCAFDLDVSVVPFVLLGSPCVFWRADYTESGGGFPIGGKAQAV